MSDEERAVVYRTADGQVVTGPQAAVLLARNRDAPAPVYRDEEELVRLLHLAVIDGDEERRRKIESEIMRARYAASLVDSETSGRTRDEASEYFARKDNERSEHWSSALERVQQAARGPWATAPTDHEMQQKRMKGQR